MSRRRRLRRALLLAYLLLLLASHIVRWAQPSAPPPAGDGLATLDVPRRAADGRALADAPTVRGASVERGPAGAPDAPLVVLLHGSPGAASNFDGLMPLLVARGLRVVAPDLPGFGHSTRDLPDYGIRAHAGYVADLIADRAGSGGAAHVVGYSLGGGVALHLADDHPSRVASLNLLASISVQEMELLGQYHLNRAIHGLQLAGLWLLHEAVPHFGALDGFLLDVPYARNFYDSDQRPLRAILQRTEPPTRIVHGRRDILVPYAAARESHRLVAQSELVTLDANHFMPFRDPAVLVDPIADFVDAVEAGGGVTRAMASPMRIDDAMHGAPVPPPELLGVTRLVWLLLLALATLASEDLTCIAAGLLVAQGRIDFASAAIACGAGIFIGDLLLYLAGRWLGEPWLARRPLRWFIDEASVARSRAWLDRRGAWMIAISRFVPGMRLPTYLTAGLLRMNAWRFTLALLLPVALWTPLLVGAARFFGERALVIFDAWSQYALGVLIAVALALTVGLRLARGLATHRGRRLLYGRWRRWRRWEFWPMWMLYPPIVVYALWLGLRHRGLTVFTAANPGIPAGGGFLGESKADILGRMDPMWVAPFAVIAPGGDAASRRAQVDAFRDARNLTLPVVLKPDVGQRGAGVMVAHSEDEIDKALAAHVDRVLLVQQYVPGREYGIFYVRRPGAERGEIFSVTDKRLPSVEGDGRRALIDLILDDPRAVAMAPAYLARHGPHLDEVPAAGESVRLVERGSHCRGAVFLDGGHLVTPALEDAVERLARSLPGFDFGRFDARVPSEMALQAGEGLQVLELNGVTSEATHIYDPSLSIWNAWRVLATQWRLAFEIGAANRAAGVQPLGLVEIARTLVRYRDPAEAKRD
ncbi:MAG: alpha/beta fold hydrolase [Acidobacteriota bacterium]